MTDPIPDERNSLLNLRTSVVTVADLLSGYGSISVPQFQRSYSWEKIHVDAFLQDVNMCLEARGRSEIRPHFFGAIVTCSSEVPGSARSHLLLVDGQQRIATIYLFLVELRKRFELAASLAKKTSEDSVLKGVLLARAKTLKENFECILDVEFKDVNTVRRLTMCYSDRAYFEQLLDGLEPEATKTSHRSIFQSHSLIETYFNAIFDGIVIMQGQSALLERLYKMFLKDWSIVHLSFDDREHANTMFRVLNTRGVQIKNCEQLRARTLEALRSQPVTKLDDLSNVWDVIINNDILDPDELLSIVYEALTGKKPTFGRQDLDYEDVFFPSMSGFKNLTTDGVRATVEGIHKLKKSVQTVSTLASGVAPEHILSNIDPVSKTRLEAMQKVLKLGYCTLPILLNAEKLGHRSFIQVVDVIERFLFRYATIAKGPIHKVQRLFSKHGQLMRKEPHEFRTTAFIADLNALINIHASDEVFTERLKALRYDGDERAAIKYLLIMNEHMFQWYSKGNQGKPTCLDTTRCLDFKKLTIEHVHARNAEAGNEQMNGLTEYLGNLTIVSEAENDRLGNKPFADKKPILAASTSDLNKEIALYEDWNLDNYTIRLNLLVERSLAIFSL
ncbi:MAG: hypothetical protein COB36_14235 [Alphaproteobacteria bacterium]|nr:MAG: hypothetical protein COB36_14235 [Alphaproteobacteria bacterium]